MSRVLGRCTDHLLGNVNFLLDCQDALLQWTAQVHLGQVVAEVGLLFDQGDQTVFDLEENGCTWFDVFRKGAVRGDQQFFAAWI